MAIVPPEVFLSAFDALAGTLRVKHSRNGRVSKIDLQLIAAQLDAELPAMNTSFLDLFEPDARDKIRAFNQKYAARAIKTFGQAIAYEL